MSEITNEEKHLATLRLLVLLNSSLVKTGQNFKYSLHHIGTNKYALCKATRTDKGYGSVKVGAGHDGFIYGIVNSIALKHGVRSDSNTA